MHYLNVVGVSETGSVAVLDTNQQLYWYTQNEFKDLLDISRYPMPSGTYVLIRFYE